jgi:TATA-box binding protein (TBP) (component of TFIID and TFIIIB)
MAVIYIMTFCANLNCDIDLEFIKQNISNIEYNKKNLMLRLNDSKILRVHVSYSKTVNWF